MARDSSGGMVGPQRLPAPPSPRAAVGFSLAAMKAALLESGPQSVFQGDNLLILRHIISTYNPNDDDYILQAAAAAWFQEKYIIALKEGADETQFPINIRQLAAQICERFYAEHQQDGQADILSKIRETKLTLGEFSVSRLEYYFTHYRGCDYSKEYLKEQYAIAKKLAGAGMEYADNEAALAIINRAWTALPHYTRDAQLIRECFYSLFQGKDESKHLYFTVKNYVLEHAPSDYLGAEEEFACSIYYLLTTATDESIKKDFTQLDAASKKILVRALQCVCRFEAFENLGTWCEWVNAHFEFDQLPSFFEGKLQEHNYSPIAYTQIFFSNYLTVENFQQSSLLGKVCITRAAHFRLLQMRIGGAQYSQDECRQYSKILEASIYHNTPSIIETLSWFDDGKLSDYPEHWLKSAAVEDIWRRVIEFEFFGDKEQFFSSNHKLLKRFIEDGKGRLIKNLKGPQILFDARAYVASKRLCDPNFKDVEERQALSFILRSYQALDAKYDEQLRGLTKDGVVDDLIKRVYAMRNGKPLQQIYLDSVVLTQALTCENYSKSSYYSSCLLARSALIRLQKIAYVNPQAYTQVQRQHYLTIVDTARFALLVDDVRFCYMAKNLLSSFQFKDGQTYAGGRFDDRYSRLIEVAFYGGCAAVGDLKAVPPAIIDLAVIDERSMPEASPKMQEVISKKGLRVALDKLEAYMLEHERLLKHSKQLPITHPPLENAELLLKLVQQYDEHLSEKDDDFARVRTVLAKLCVDGSYDDKFIMYEKAVEERFSGLEKSFLVHQPNGASSGANCKWQFKGPAMITNLLLSKNYDAGSYKTRLLLTKAAICLFEADSYGAHKEALEAVVLRARNDLDWYDLFPATVQERLGAIIKNPEMVGDCEASDTVAPLRGARRLSMHQGVSLFGGGSRLSVLLTGKTLGSGEGNFTQTTAGAS